MPHVWFNPDSPDLSAADVTAILNAAEQSDLVLKEDRRGRVVAVTHASRRYVVKQYAMPWIKAWLYQLVRRTPAWREWHGARRLARVGVRVVVPLALVHHGRGRWKQSLVMPYIEGTSLMHFLADASLTQGLRLAVLTRIGEQVSQMLTAGIVNRDHKAPNLLVDAEAAAGRQPPWVIDPAGLRRATPRQVRRMLDLLIETMGRRKPLTEEEILLLRDDVYSECPYFRT